jgi:ACS family glucarate transporter-like MFS transporter
VTAKRDTPSALPHPSAVRWQILGLMLLLSMITYLDRVNISIAARLITKEYGLSDVQMGKIFSAFIFAYGLFQVPGGWLADKFGPRKVLTFSALWWSLATAGTAWIGGFGRILSVVLLLGFARFCVGMGEAAAWPSFNRTIAAWMAIKERGFAASVPLAGGGVGAAITPPFIAWLMLTYGWRWAFLISALLGVAGSAIWYVRSGDTPEQHPGVNQAELEIIHADWQEPLKATERRIPWGNLVRERNMWLLFLSAMTCGYMVYIYMTWFFTYLVEQRHLTQMTSSYYTIGPFIAMAVLTPIGGAASDLIARRLTLRWGRRLISMGGMTAAGISLLIGARVENISIAILFLSFGAGAIYFALASHWATSIDISQKYAGTISGVMNCGGNVGGILSPILTPLLARRFGWVPALDVAAVTILAGAMIWFLIDPRRNEALS